MEGGENCYRSDKLVGVAREICVYFRNIRELKNYCKLSNRKSPQSQGRFSYSFRTFNPFGLISHQKNLESLDYAVFRARRITFFPVNRGENQNGGRLGSFWFSTRFTRKKVIRLARKTA